MTTGLGGQFRPSMATGLRKKGKSTVVDNWSQAERIDSSVDDNWSKEREKNRPSLTTGLGTLIFSSTRQE